MKERQDTMANDNDSARQEDDNEDELDAKPERKNWTSVLVEDKVEQPKAITGKARMPVERDAEEYNMNHPFRGKAVIFNQELFKVDGLGNRDGTNKDRDDLARTLRKMEFKIESYNDLSKHRLLQKILDLSNEDHSDRDCLVVIVLSHGETDIIYAADGSYHPDELWDPFTAERCPTLAGKPKIFLIQACKGEQVDGGTVLHPNTISFHETDSGPFSDTYKIPNRADFLVVFSTFPGYYSWRNSRQGSWFIQSVCKVLGQHGHEKELLSMITAVSRNVALEFESQMRLDAKMDKKKQIPFVTHTLIREVYFRPKAKFAGEIRSTGQTLTTLTRETKDGSIPQPSITRNTVDERPHRNQFTDCKACCCVV